ncbi:transmembrane protein 45A [Hyalella azteca]|uniref:Transmembrane protein 45A n=1 Tax=Hyalella azteca TaxID=294128 RepID=A0A8B7N405_HYAAZ|nr:transmembrane protein 45A [Hyalella azteca]
MGLVYTTLLTSAGMLCEMKYRHSVLAAISRPYFLAVESTWLCQMAFILFPQFGGTLDNEDPIQIMTVSMLFNWHFAGNIALVGILATIAHLQVRRKTPDQILKHLEKDLCEARRHSKNRNCRRSSEYMVMINEEEKEELSIVSD